MVGAGAWLAGVPHLCIPQHSGEWCQGTGEGPYGQDSTETVTKEKSMTSGWKSQSHSAVSDSATPWTVAHQAPVSMGFSRQEYCNGCPFLLQGIFLAKGLNPGIQHCRQIFDRLISRQTFACMEMATPRHRATVIRVWWSPGLGMAEGPPVQRRQLRHG